MYDIEMQSPAATSTTAKSVTFTQVADNKQPYPRVGDVVVGIGVVVVVVGIGGVVVGGIVVAFVVIVGVSVVVVVVVVSSFTCKAFVESCVCHICFAASRCAAASTAQLATQLCSVIAAAGNRPCTYIERTTNGE
jgi:hypothetical protein